MENYKNFVKKAVFGHISEFRIEVKTFLEKYKQ